MKPNAIINHRLFWYTWVEKDNGDNINPYMRHWKNWLTHDKACNRVPLEKNASFKFIMKRYYETNSHSTNRSRYWLYSSAF